MVRVVAEILIARKIYVTSTITFGYNLGEEKKEEKSVRGLVPFTTIVDETDYMRISLFQKTVTMPSENVEVYDGHYVSMRHLENYENLTACILTGPEVC